MSERLKDIALLALIFGFLWVACAGFVVSVTELGTALVRALRHRSSRGRRRGTLLRCGHPRPERPAMNEKSERLVCACGTPIPAARAGSEHCSTECDQAEAERQRDAEWHGLMDEQVARLSGWVRDQLMAEARSRQPR